MLDALLFDPGLNQRWRTAVNAHKAHAAAEWPREAVGYITEAGQYVACENVHATPETNFQASDADYTKFDADEPAALLHSHTSSLSPSGAESPPMACPSKDDMEAQIDMAIPWGISLCYKAGASDPFWFGDEVERPPLIGRSFIHGVNDCYSLVRDWHKQTHNISLPDYPRGRYWWEQGESMYDQFEEAGFVRVERGSEGVRPGDCFICKIRSDVPNHAGIYIGNGMILQHLQERLSRRDPASIWRKQMDFTVRHKDVPDDWEG